MDHSGPHNLGINCDPSCLDINDYLKTVKHRPHTPFKRVHTSTGLGVNITGSWTISGPQSLEHIPEEIVDLLASRPGIHSVTVQYENLHSPDGAMSGKTFRRMESEPERLRRLAAAHEQQPK